MAKFFRGKSTSFNAETHKDGLFFATDVNELYMSYEVNGEVITRTYGSEYLIKDIDLVDNTTIKISYRDETIDPKTINLIDVLQKATEEAAGLMSAEDKANFNTLWSAFENDELGKVQGISETDKVLSINEKIISSTVSFDYDEDTKTLRLLGKERQVQKEDGQVVFEPYVLGSVDATPFIKDGVLEDVEIVTIDNKKYIEFTWKVETEGGTAKKDRIAVDDLLIHYTAGNGINISNDYKIGVKLDPATGNFLRCDNDGLKMTNITTNATTLQEDIVVAGLNGTFGTGNYKNGDTISAGTNIYDILVKILSQEIYPTAAKVSNAGGITSTFAAPSFTLTSSGSTVEVGTTITVGGVTGYDPTATPTSRQFTGFTNGYSLKYNINGNTGNNEVDNNFTNDFTGAGVKVTVVSGNPPSVSFPSLEEYLAEDENGERTYTGDGEPVTLNTGTFKLTRTYSGTGSFGLTGAALTTTSTNASSTSCKIDGVNNLIAKEGTNKVTYKMEGPGHKGKIPSNPRYYVASNLKNSKSTLAVAAQTVKTVNNTSATAGTKELTVTGAYYNIYQMSATPGITAVTSSADATDTSVGVGKKYKTFNANTTSFSITANTVAEIVILSKSLTVTAASWVSAGFTQDWIGSVKNEVGAVDFVLPDKTTVKYNKITIVASATGDKFGTDGTLNITF